MNTKPLNELYDEVKSLSSKVNSQSSSAVTEFQKQLLVVHADIEKTLIELLSTSSPVKVVLFGVYYFWFTLAVPMYNPKLKIDNPLSYMTDMIMLVRSKVKSLPDPKFSTDVKTLNEKMQQLKAYLPHPAQLDVVNPALIQEQTERVNTAIHTISSKYLEENVHPELVANALFSHWLHLSVFFGVSEKEWQKTDYYSAEILQEVKHYFAKKL